MIMLSSQCISPVIPLSVAIVACIASSMASLHNSRETNYANSRHGKQSNIITLTKKSSEHGTMMSSKYMPEVLTMKKKQKKAVIAKRLKNAPTSEQKAKQKSPKSDARIKIYPEKVITYAGSKTTFSCIVIEGLANTIEWLVNGVPLKDLQLEDVEMGMIHTAGNLVFNHMSIAYNNSTIQCRVDFSDSTTAYSSKVHIVVQGKLDSVHDLSFTYLRGRNSYKFNWSSPSTLNIPFFQNNLTFCIEIDTTNSFAQVCKKDAGFVLSQIDAATEYEVNITAVNAAGRGKTTTVKLPGKPNIVSITAVLTPPPIKHLIALSDAVASCNAALTSSFSMFINCNEGSGIMEVFSRDFKYNEKHVVTIHYFNSKYKRSATLNLSTYDVQDLFLEAAQNKVFYTVKFANNSEARGMLAIFLFIGPDGPDITHSRYIILGKEKALKGNTLDKMSGGQYEVKVFDIESDGLIKSKSPALETEVNVSGDKMYGNAFQEFHTKALCAAFNTSTNKSIEVSCELDTSLFVGFVVLSQYIDPIVGHLEEITIKYSESIHHPVVINGTNNGAYLVTVMPLSGSTNLIGSGSIFKKKVYLNGFRIPIASPTSIITEPISSTIANTTVATKESSFTYIHIIAIVAAIAVIGVCLSIEILLIIVYFKVKTNILRVTKINTAPVENEGQKSFQSGKCSCAGIRVNSLCTMCNKSNQPSNLPTAAPNVFQSGPALSAPHQHIRSEFRDSSRPLSSTLLNAEHLPPGNPHRPLHALRHDLPEINLSTISPPPRDIVDPKDNKMKMTYVYAKVRRPKKRTSLQESSSKELYDNASDENSEETLVYSSKSTNQSLAMNRDHICNEMKSMADRVSEPWRKKRERTASCNCQSMIVEEPQESSGGTDTSEDQCKSHFSSENRAMVVSALKDMGLDSLAKEYLSKNSSK